MSELKKLTRLGSDTKKIAALLQAKAPKGHMLAYISPKEAAILKARGGSGKPHADTGILSFEEEGAIDIGFGPGEYTPQDTPAPAAAPAEAYSTSPMDVFSQQYQDYSVMPPVAPAPVSAADVTAQQAALSTFPQVQTGAPTPTAARDIAIGDAALREQIGAEAPKEEGAADKLAKASGLSKETLGRLGLAGALGMFGSRTAAKAGEVGQKGAQQMQAIASPYQAAGQQLQAQAQRGELTPAAQQSIQAMQAQAAQAAERRGGVGAQQAQAQVERLRQQLLQQQYDYGLKLSGIGDNIALGAIKTGLQADQYVNQLTNNFYSNMAYIASGMSPGVRVGGNK